MLNTIVGITMRYYCATIVLCNCKTAKIIGEFGKSNSIYQVNTFLHTFQPRWRSRHSPIFPPLYKIALYVNYCYVLLYVEGMFGEFFESSVIRHSYTYRYSVLAM